MLLITNSNLEGGNVEDDWDRGEEGPGSCAVSSLFFTGMKDKEENRKKTKEEEKEEEEEYNNNKKTKGRRIRVTDKLDSTVFKEKKCAVF